MILKYLFRRTPTKPSEADRTMALFQIMDNANVWLANAGPEDEAAREKVQAIREHAVRELRRDPMSNPARLPYEVTQVIHATDTEPEKRTVVAAFLEPATADWFTDQIVVAPGTHYETPGLAPAEFPGLPTDSAP